jgi:hypothetical protein
MKFSPLCAVVSCAASLVVASPRAFSIGGKAVGSDSSSSAIGANAGLGGRIPFPVDNPWNQDVAHEPTDPNSSRIINAIGGGGVVPDFGDYFGMPYVVVSGTQKRVRVNFDYGDQSDPGPYPIPPDAPVEGGSDRHVMVLDRDNWMLYELYAAGRSGDGWHATSGAIFDLSSNQLRPAGWTSADGAGLPMLPGLVRYDEACEQQEIRHALRFTVSRTRKAYIAPARHFASGSHDSCLPPMGMRVRLKADYDVSNFPPCAQVVLRAMKTYGMLVADHGSSWYISGAPDHRWDNEALRTLRRVRGRDFEVVRMSGVVEGE